MDSTLHSDWYTIPVLRQLPQIDQDSLEGWYQLSKLIRLQQVLVVVPEVHRCIANKMGLTQKHPNLGSLQEIVPSGFGEGNGPFRVQQPIVV